MVGSNDRLYTTTMDGGGGCDGGFHGGFDGGGHGGGHCGGHTDDAGVVVLDDPGFDGPGGWAPLGGRVGRSVRSDLVITALGMLVIAAAVLLLVAVATLIGH
jgi:hypothetical protein